MIDWGAFEGWLITAILLLVPVGFVWWRRWRRDPAGFAASWRRLPPDWRQSSDRFRPPR